MKDFETILARLPEGTELLLYDGECGLCGRLNRFVLARDRSARYRFAPLQGELARRVLARHGRDASGLDTFYLVRAPGRPGERVFARSGAALRALAGLGGAWTVTRLALLVPRPVRDAAYDLVARNRRRLFGAGACTLARPEHRARFLELEGDGA